MKTTYRSFRCAQQSDSTDRGATNDTVRWAQSLGDMPDWLVATSYGLTVGEAQRVQGVVAKVLLEVTR